MLLNERPTDRTSLSPAEVDAWFTSTGDWVAAVIRARRPVAEPA